ncbi:phospholipase D-like domain-containing protein [Leptolyngbya sp. FACHB-1515]
MINAIGMVVLVLLLGIFTGLYVRGSFRPKPEFDIAIVPNTNDITFFLAVAGLTTSLTTQAEVTGFFVEAPEIYPARIAAIRRAQRTLHFETFFMTPGKRADEFASAICDRAQAGVKVRLIIDNHGAHTMPKEYWRSLRSAGVELGFFRDFDWRAPFDYNARTHRKLLLIDGEEALLGGAGVSDSWDGERNVPWCDFEVGYRGPIVTLLEGVFMENWASVGGALDLGSDVFRTHPPEGRAAFVTKGTFSLENSPLRLLFHTSMAAARQRLWLASPYLVPDPSTQEVLIQACQRGVDVRILTMGKRNDKSYVYYSARELYGRLLKAGVKIFEYQPSMMHAKLLLVDDRWVSHGSTNVDERSFFINDELNVSVSDPDLAMQMEKFLITSFENSVLVTIDRWRKRSIVQRIRGRIGLLFRRLF